MELKGRLRLIADKVPACNSICDIGTDHAYIPIYLVEKGITKRAIASDVREGPVLAAKENVKKYSVESLVEVRLGNGLETVAEGEVEVIIIAGMGGILISEILTGSMSVVRSADTIILQPMNALDDLRSWLYSNGFDIIDEELVDEGEKIYDVMTVKWIASVKRPGDLNCFIGEKLIEKRDPLLRKYIEKKMKQLDKVIYEIEASKAENEIKVHAVKLYDELRSLVSIL